MNFVEKLLKYDNDLKASPIPGLKFIIEVIKGRLYFASVKWIHNILLKRVLPYYAFFDYEFEYQGFDEDFGPFNLAVIYSYCLKMNELMNEYSPELGNKPIIHFTEDHEEQLVNSAFLLGCYLIIYHEKTSKIAYKLLTNNCKISYKPYRDAAFGTCDYPLHLNSCFDAIHKSKNCGILNFQNFDLEEYLYYERVKNGDLNWIIPNKILAFCGPHGSKNDNAYSMHPPEHYFEYFRKTNVKLVVRLNEKVYDANRFINNGFEHKDLFFFDGSVPSLSLAKEFVELCESTNGAVAVHCKAGLGRTGTLIACYMMKHYKFKAQEAIAWIRICRPGSVIGPQQHWLSQKQTFFWSEGKKYYSKNSDKKNNNIENIDSPIHINLYHDQNQEEEKRKEEEKNFDNRPSKILKKLTCGIKKIELKDASLRRKNFDNFEYLNSNQISNKTGTNKGKDMIKETSESQGDRLNRIKAMRQPKQLKTNESINASLKRQNSQSKCNSETELPKSLSCFTHVYNTRSKEVHLTQDLSFQDKNISDNKDSFLCISNSISSSSSSNQNKYKGR